jgi:hypothetical protein
LAAAVKEQDSLYAYVNKHGKILLKANVPLFNPFKHGLAIVYANGLLGAVNKKGEIIIPYRYHAINEFINGWALVERDNYFNYINPEGALLLDSYVDNASSFSEGRASIANDLGKWAMINTRGMALTAYHYDFIEPIKEGMCRFYRDGLSGFLNKNGVEVIAAEYDTEKAAGNYQSGDAGPFQFNDGLAVVSKYGRYGFIDKKGKIIIPLKYESAQPFRGAYALITLNGKEGYIDKKGNVFFND